MACIELALRFPCTVEGVVAQRRVFRRKWWVRWWPEATSGFLVVVYLSEQVAPCSLQAKAHL